MAHWLRKIDQPSPASEAILTSAASAGGPDAATLKRLGRAMTKVTDLRNKAAHVELVGSDGWDRAVRRVLVGDNALMAQIAATLSPLRRP
jgi:pyocin large subunit-like protein